MDIQKMLDTMSEASRRDRSNYHMTLGALIEELKKLPNSDPVRFDSGGSPGKPHSYRGYYSDLSFPPVPAETTVQDLLIYCTAALGATFEGYKGGDFVMGSETPLWTAEWGDCGCAIVSATRAPDGLTLVTKQID